MYKALKEPVKSTIGLYDIISSLRVNESYAYYIL